MLSANGSTGLISFDLTQHRLSPYRWLVGLAIPGGPAMLRMMNRPVTGHPH
jgi:hypothetical protein